MTKYIILIGGLLLLGFGCKHPDTDEVEATYPSEEHFQTRDTFAFYLNDLLWIPLGVHSSSGLLGSSIPNTPNFSYGYDAIRNIHRLHISCRMTFRKEGNITFDQYFNLRMRYSGELPATIPLDSADFNNFVISDKYRDRLYSSASSEEPVILEITTLDTLNHRIEGIFEGSLIRSDAIGEPVEITSGRFSFTY